MRVLFTNNALVWGGAEKNTLQIMAGLRERGHEPVLACAPWDSMMEPARAQGFPIVSTPFRTKRNPLGVIYTWQAIRQVRPDVVLTNGTRTVMSAGLSARLTGTRFAVRAVAEISPPIPLRIAQLVICLSVSMEQFARKCGVPAERIQLIPNGVDTDSFCPDPQLRGQTRRELSLREDHFVLVLVGRIAGGKGHRYAVEALSQVLEQLPNTVLLIVGEGGLEQEVHEQIASLGLEGQVKMLGFHRDPRPYYAAADVALVPSHWNEAGAVVSIEAQAMGLPVIASRDGGLPEYIAEGETGLLVPPADAASLAEAILLLRKSRQRREAMGAAGRRRVMNFYGLEKMIDRYAEVLLEFTNAT
ncbi:MAG: glycosyltransferase [Armatimonadetes bacterium]|nr:glycosyltransferase [Armatimonadota bacterium]